MGKDTDYAIDEYRIVDGQNVDVKAHVYAKFDGIFRGVDFTGTGPLKQFLEYALKQAKLDLATKIRNQAGAKGPIAAAPLAVQEKYERLWELVEKHGVDFLNPEPSDPAGKLRSELEDLRKVQRKYPDANLQATIERLERKISMLEG